jgi:hypothetical protein
MSCQVCLQRPSHVLTTRKTKCGGITDQATCVACSSRKASCSFEDEARDPRFNPYLRVQSIGPADRHHEARRAPTPDMQSESVNFVSGIGQALIEKASTTSNRAERIKSSAASAWMFTTRESGPVLQFRRHRFLLESKTRGPRCPPSIYRPSLCLSTRNGWSASYPTSTLSSISRKSGSVFQLRHGDFVMGSKVPYICYIRAFHVSPGCPAIPA